MKSLRSLVTLIIVIIMCLLSFALMLNNFYLKPVLLLWDDINNNLIEFNETYIEADLQIRVLNNVVSQINSYQVIEVDRLNRITQAYNINYTDLDNKYNKLTGISHNIYDTLKDLKSYRLLSYFIDQDSLLNTTEVLIQETVKFGSSILTLPSVNLENQKSYIDSLHNTYLELRIPFEDLRSNYTKTNSNLIPSFIRIVNIALILLFLSTIALVSFIKKILGRDIKYIVDSFNILNSNNYDISKTPKLDSMFIEEKLIGEFVEDIFNERFFINKIKEIVSAEYIIDEIIEKLLILVKDTLNTDRIGVAFVDYKTQSIVAEHGAFNYGKVLLGPGFEVKFENTRLTELIETRKPTITQSIQRDLKERPNSDSLRLLDKEGIKSNMIIPLIINDVVIGFLFFSSIKENNYNERSLQLGVKISSEISNILDKTYLTKKMFSTVTRTFANLVEKRDNETGNHILRMTHYSRIISEALMNHKDKNYRVNESFINDIINYASIHDIGKIGIPDSILKKPGRLTDDERRIMQEHSAIGGNILKDLEQSLEIFNRDFYKTAIDIANYHHERWDGKGYPEGLKGQEIPLAARIVSIADVFDALSSRRVYKNSFGFEESVRIINEGAGTQFDPQLVNVFNSVLQNFKEVYESEYLHNEFLEKVI